jgi:hypothetical protein
MQLADVSKWCGQGVAAGIELPRVPASISHWGLRLNDPLMAELRYAAFAFPCQRFCTQYSPDR